MRVRSIAVVPDSVADVVYWIFIRGAQTLSDSSLRASEPATAAESIRLIQLTNTPGVPGPSLKTCQQRMDLITVSASFLIFHVICVVCSFCSAGYIISRFTVANSAQPCFTECSTNVRVNTTQGEKGSITRSIFINIFPYSISTFV